MYTLVGAKVGNRRLIRGTRVASGVVTVSMRGFRVVDAGYMRFNQRTPA